MKIQLLSGPAGTRVIDIAHEKGVDISPARAIEIVLEAGEILQRIMAEYAEAGADVMLAPAIGANRSLLSDSQTVATVNKRILNVTREAAADKPTGAMVSLPCSSPSRRVIDWMNEQMLALADAGTDFYMLETLTTIDGAKALTECALEASVKTGRDIPLHISLTPAVGFDIAAAAQHLMQYNPASIGLNCFYPPQKMNELISLLPTDANLSLRPALSQPGSPLITPQEFCLTFRPCIKDDRLKYVGTCCGATPLHTTYLKNLLTNVG